MQAMRLPGVEPGAQVWEACMLPLHYGRRYCLWARDNVCVQAPRAPVITSMLFSLVSKGYGSGFQTPAT